MPIPTDEDLNGLAGGALGGFGWYFGKIRVNPSNDDDIFLGTRLTLNDEQDSTLLAGTTIDLGSSATILFVEAERRLGDHWKLEIEARFFPHIPKKEFATGFKDDGFITTRLSYFF